MKHEFSGIGLIIINMDLFGIDLDNCLKEGQILKWAEEIVNRFTDTYIEISPSGQGLHILGYGELNLRHNISPINKHIEAYDGNSVRYLTLTGKLFKKSSKHFHYYETNNEHIEWLRKNFFTINSINIKPDTKKENTLIINKQSFNKKILDIEQLIQTSKDAELFYRYQSKYLVHDNSTSEDDWHFCLLILKYMRNANFELLQEFLLRYRNRSKLSRKDYIKLTINKAIQEAEKHNLTGINIQERKQNKKELTKSKVKKNDILKYCNIFSLFTIRTKLFTTQQQILIKKDNKNFIKVFTYHSLNGVDLDNYIGILQSANLNCNNEPYIDYEATGNILNTVKVKINFSQLSYILQKQDGGKFRNSILQTIRKMSSIYFEYKKIIDREGNYIEGGSHLLSWHNHQNIKNMTVAINPFAWHVMKYSTYNYCLININERFKLENIQQRLLYFHLCQKVIPGSNYFYEFNIQELSDNLCGYTLNKHTNKARKKSVRKICQALYEQQSKLTDFIIHLIKEKQIIQSIRVKRHKLFLE